MKEILRVKRANIVERAHLGAVLLFGNEKILSEVGYDTNPPCYYLRSCAKPLQSSVLADLGVFDFFAFTPQEIAVVSSSHSGTFNHIERIENILRKIGKSASDLKCGIHPPLDADTRKYLIKNNLELSCLHHNCSGKHAGFLAACVMKGWDCTSYLDFEHPLQKIIIEKISYYCDYPPQYVSKDGCSAPILAMLLGNMCRGFLKCFQNYPSIKDAMAQNPYFMGGENRIDSEIIFASGGRLVAKVGAEGICMVFNSQNEQVLLVKILDSNEQARAIVLLEALLQLNWLTNDEIENNPLKKFFDKTVKTSNGEVIGEIVADFSL